ncbi:MAG TPA: cobyric acid synthase [Terriglobia bacterium]|nr:cobyric acid synthase [Terriglobia bacterium]
MKSSLMIVGTASHAGKSILATALCRILNQRGVRVAPFKSQNMALNSYVCRDGSEIGRAQASQAEAAGIEPEGDMNPILLKPANNRQIQVVLHGRVYRTMTAGNYYEQKSFFFEKSLESFYRLASKFDVIILEGAGSTVEVNLKDRDIVNLPFARAVGSPALLIADIDRGGVFASIAGTFALLDDEERRLIRGFVINRFRGDLRLFEGGTEFLEKHTGRPCFGVLPYIEALRIDQEDSVSLEDHRTQRGSFRVGVIRLPHISNYTDFNPLECIPGVALEYLNEPEAVQPFDLVIIPGTKNTIADLRSLVDRGFKKLLLDTLERGGWVLGICGGYQMLGRKVSDPFATEEGGTEHGLDFLPVETRMETTKVTVQSKGRSFLGPIVAGYEIHMGRTDHLRPIEPFLTKENEQTDGAISGHVAGTYFHGLFENADFTAKFLTMVAESRRLDWRPGVIRYSKNDEYNRLAATVREHLDMDRIYEVICGGGQ